MTTVGILTGGGDCPGLNAVIRGAVRKLSNNNVETIGIMEGWRGMLEQMAMPLTVSNTDGILAEGGTILGTSRTNPYKEPDTAVPKIQETFAALGLDSLIAVGGDDTLGVANKLYLEHKLNTIGVPKTIDNDLSGTDVTFGFDTAINIAMEAIDRLHTTAKSHRRCVVVEIMGRHAGWITAFAGLAGAADVVLVPERNVSIEQVCDILKRNRADGQIYNMVAVSEGAVLASSDMVTQDGEVDEFGHVHLGGIAKNLAELIEKHTGYETRHVVLGHTQRGGKPTAFDRMLGTRYGIKAAELVLAKDFGKMVALHGNTIVGIPLADGVGETKVLTADFLAVLDEFHST